MTLIAARLGTAGAVACAVLAFGGQALAAEPKTVIGPPVVIKGHGGPVKALAVSPNGRMLLSGSFDYSAIAHAIGKGDESTTPNAQASRQMYRIDAVDGAINAVGISGAMIAIAGDGRTLRLFDRTTGEPRGTGAGHEHKINHLDVARDGSAVVTASWDRTARIWPVSATAVGAPRVLTGHRGPVNAAVFDRAAATVVTASYDGTLRRFDARTGELKRRVHKHGWGVNALTRIPGSDTLAFGAIDGTVGLIEVGEGDRLKTLAKHDKPVLAITARGGRLATAGADGVIRVWNTETWEHIEDFKNPYGPVWALAFSPDAKTLYWGGLDDTIHVWQVTPRKPFEQVASKFPRRFQLRTNSDDPVELGRIQFARKCSVCHTLTPDGANRAGPTLHGIFGRRIATVEGYAYSKPLYELDIVWTPETVSKLFELGPDKFTPGSKMPLQKMNDAKQRDALIAFLKVATAKK